MYAYMLVNYMNGNFRSIFSMKVINIIVSQQSSMETMYVRIFSKSTFYLCEH